MNLFAKSFTFGGKSLSADYYMCAFEDEGVIKETALRTETNKTVLTPYRSQLSLYGIQYENPITFEISIIRADEAAFTISEISEFYNWLLSPITYQDFTVQDFDGEDYHKDIIYHSICIGHDEFRIGTAVKGLKFYFECDAPYGYTSTISTPFSVNDIVTIDNTSDETQIDIYPLITLSCNAREQVTIYNSVYPNEKMTLQVLQGQKLTIDNAAGIIVDNTNMFSFENDFNLTWVHLRHGENKISITGNVSGTIQCSFIRKRGI